MMEVAKKQNIIWQWISWQYIEVPRNLLTAWKNFLLFNLNYFSIPLLLKTLFSHWRRYKWSSGKGFDAAKFLEAKLSNLISRILGAIIRSIIIVIGLAAEAIIFFTGAIVFFTWLFLPVFLISGFIWGVVIIF